MTKSFLTSKTIWANLIALIASVSMAAGLDIGLTPEVQGTILLGIMSVVNLGLRAVTKTGITVGQD